MDDIDALKALIDRLQMKLSGGLTSFGVGAKHLFLKDAYDMLPNLIVAYEAMKAERDNATAQVIELENIMLNAIGYPEDCVNEGDRIRHNRNLKKRATHE